ncbi:MAG: hypothetical protein GY845_02410 [Planctomycetes bacterium]|nr:hypothetical protein [Planctomycetota bacterium]
MDSHNEFNTPPGWKTIKISEDAYIEIIPQEQIEAWDHERRQKDKLHKLMQKDGFHIKQHGRTGTIYYIDSGRVCEIDFELAGVRELDILISPNAIESWALPEHTVLTQEERDNIRRDLKNWLIKKGIKADLCQQPY